VTNNRQLTAERQYLQEGNYKDSTTTRKRFVGWLQGAMAKTRLKNKKIHDISQTNNSVQISLFLFLSAMFQCFLFLLLGIARYI
jgi:uncharacterized membrane protein YqjE